MSRRRFCPARLFQPIVSLHTTRLCPVFLAAYSARFALEETRFDDFHDLGPDTDPCQAIDRENTSNWLDGSGLLK
jgi:hypothetical protein